MKTYVLTAQQLDMLLHSTVAMYVEYKECYEHTPESAEYAAVKEMIDGLDADRELAANDPTERLRLQLPSNDAEDRYNRGGW